MNLVRNMFQRIRSSQLIIYAMVIGGPVLLGCEKQEKRFELKSPEVDVRVEKSDEGVQVDVHKQSKPKNDQ